MKRAIAAALLASTLLAGLAHAQPKGDAASAAAESGRTMDAAYIAVPVVREGRLVNYLFVTLRIEIAPGVDLWRTRERAHFLRDALVRAAHQRPIAHATRDDQLDNSAALAAFRAAAQEALGAQAVRTVTIVSTYSSRQTAALSQR